MDEGKYYDEAIRYLAEDMTNEERTGFEAFLDGDPLRKEELEVLRKLWANTAAYDSKPPETDVQKQWERFSNGAFIEESKVVPLNRRWRQLSRIAAVALLIVTSWFTWRVVLQPSTQSSEILVRVEQGQKLVELPDGSTVYLNEHSELTYDSRFKQRIVTLAGEGYFEVQHLDSDAPFQVRAGKTQTTVLGTTFNVRAYPDEGQVAVNVFEGKVALQEVASADKVLLEKGESAAYVIAENRVTDKMVANANTAAWKTRKLSYTDVRLGEVLEDLKRVYGVDFEVQNDVVLECTFRSDFSDEQLEDILDEIEFALHLTIEKQATEDVWSILGSGCADMQ